MTVIDLFDQHGRDATSAAAVHRERRWAAVGHAGATVWLTGLTGSGRSALAAALEAELLAAGRPAYVLDDENAGDVARTAAMARLLADAGLVAIAALESPSGLERARARALHAAAELPFIEVWLSGPEGATERRADGPYEPPTCPELEVGPHLSAGAAVQALLGALDAAEYARRRDARQRA